MHIQDGFLTGKWVVGWFGASSLFLTRGIFEIKRKADKEMMFKPLLGLISAAVFFISLLPIPVPITGTSSHPTGTPLAAILLGPFVSSVLAVVALLLQALFFAHGGLSTLGANTFSMGVTGSFVGFGVYRICKKSGLSPVISAGIAGFIGDISVYCVTSFQLATGMPGASTAHFLPKFYTFIMLFMPTQLPLAVLEGLITGGMVSYISKVRPDILRKLRVVESRETEEA